MKKYYLGRTNAATKCMLLAAMCLATFTVWADSDDQCTIFVNTTGNTSDRYCSTTSYGNDDGHTNNSTTYDEGQTVYWYVTGYNGNNSHSGNIYYNWNNWDDSTGNPSIYTGSSNSWFGTANVAAKTSGAQLYARLRTDGKWRDARCHLTVYMRAKQPSVPSGTYNEGTSGTVYVTDNSSYGGTLYWTSGSGSYSGSGHNATYALGKITAYFSTSGSYNSSSNTTEGYIYERCKAPTFSGSKYFQEGANISGASNQSKWSGTMKYSTDNSSFSASKTVYPGAVYARWEPSGSYLVNSNSNYAYAYVYCTAPTISNVYFTEGSSVKVTATSASSYDSDSQLLFPGSSTWVANNSYVSTPGQYAAKAIANTSSYAYALNSNVYTYANAYRYVKHPTVDRTAGTYHEGQVITVKNNSALGKFSYIKWGAVPTTSSYENYCSGSNTSATTTTVVRPGTLYGLTTANTSSYAYDLDNTVNFGTYSVKCYTPTASFLTHTGDSLSGWTEGDKMRLTAKTAHRNGMVWSFDNSATPTTHSGTLASNMLYTDIEVVPGKLTAYNKAGTDSYLQSETYASGTFTVTAKTPILTTSGVIVQSNNSMVAINKNSNQKLYWRWSDEYRWTETTAAKVNLYPRQGVTLEAYCGGNGYISSATITGDYQMKCARPAVTAPGGNVLFYNDKLTIAPTVEPELSQVAWQWDGGEAGKAEQGGDHQIWARLGAISARSTRDQYLDSDDETVVFDTYRAPDGLEYGLNAEGGLALKGYTPLTMRTANIPATVAMHDGGESYAVARIAAGAFSQCCCLEELTIANPEPPVLDEGAFTDDQYSTVSLNVPQELREVYANAPVWCRFFGHTDNIGKAKSGSVYTVSNGILTFHVAGAAYTVGTADGRIWHKGLSQRGQQLRLPAGMVVVKADAQTEKHLVR